MRIYNMALVCAATLEVHIPRGVGLVLIRRERRRCAMQSLCAAVTVPQFRVDFKSIAKRRRYKARATKRATVEAQSLFHCWFGPRERASMHDH